MSDWQRATDQFNSALSYYRTRRVTFVGNKVVDANKCGLKDGERVIRRGQGNEVIHCHQFVPGIEGDAGLMGRCLRRGALGAFAVGWWCTGSARGDGALAVGRP